MSEPNPTTLVALQEAIMALHEPGYEIAGVWYDHVVSVGCEPPEGHVCRHPKQRDPCDVDDHYALACVECRGVTEDGEPGYPFWPCPTARLVMPQAGEQRG